MVQEGNSLLHLGLFDFGRRRRVRRVFLPKRPVFQQGRLLRRTRVDSINARIGYIYYILDLLNGEKVDPHYSNV